MYREGVVYMGNEDQQARPDLTVILVPFYSSQLMLPSLLYLTKVKKKKKIQFIVNLYVIFNHLATNEKWADFGGILERDSSVLHTR